MREGGRERERVGEMVKGGFEGRKAGRKEELMRAVELRERDDCI